MKVYKLVPTVLVAVAAAAYEHFTSCHTDTYSSRHNMVESRVRTEKGGREKKNEK
jgi:hypothetical protein